MLDNSRRSDNTGFEKVLNLAMSLRAWAESLHMVMVQVGAEHLYNALHDDGLYSLQSWAIRAAIMQAPAVKRNSYAHAACAKLVRSLPKRSDDDSPLTSLLSDQGQALKRLVLMELKRIERGL